MAELFAPDLLKDQHVVVTGGGTGLGRAMAERFATLGAAVTVGGRREGPLKETTEAIRGRGQTAEWAVVNVREAERVAAFFEAAEERNGPVTRLVNNAAANFLAATHTLTDNGFDAVVRTNLYGAFFCTRWCGQRWIERGTPGVVLSITTTYAATGSAFVVPSAVSKAGIEAMTRSLAAEWGLYGIRLNCIAPGPFPTEGAWERLVPDPQMAEHMKRRVPLRRFGEPDELADVAAFLLSDLSRYLTGAVVPLDGGEVLASGGQFNDLAKQDREGVLALFAMMRSAREKA
jgi:NAD(P)-dependent dehydrogenase (short-subunit alcohol dehydrogenase family)